MKRENSSAKIGFNRTGMAIQPLIEFPNRNPNPVMELDAAGDVVCANRSTGTLRLKRKETKL